MTGHMGDVRRTVQNPGIMEVQDDTGLLLLIYGSVPGGKNGYVTVRNAIKRTGAFAWARCRGTPRPKAAAKSRPPLPEATSRHGIGRHSPVIAPVATIASTSERAKTLCRSLGLQAPEIDERFHLVPPGHKGCGSLIWAVGLDRGCSMSPGGTGERALSLSPGSRAAPRHHPAQSHPGRRCLYRPCPRRCAVS